MVSSLSSEYRRPLFQSRIHGSSQDWFNSQVPSTTEAPVDAGDDVSTPIPDQLSQVFIFACIAGHHCGPVRNFCNRT